ncbi:hypothetical protein OIE66_11970 [Nonomuraea sp. NBC_01738]|uniref:hypothetical protein n=1 Tax=Nonomuraea sp. NBC_01738 TaxID=2976003 RepID=UPI002E12588F|nr:hypothetical protein OIE66_11970 [Nonomuraea sp. NBC_01738]
MAAVVVMLFTVLFLLTDEPDPIAATTTTATESLAPEEEPSAEPTGEASQSASAPPSDPPPTGTPKYTGEVDPCKLLGEDVTTKLTLYPDQSQIYKEECEWSTRTIGDTNNMMFRLEVYAKVFPDLAAADQQFKAQRQDTALLTDTWQPTPEPVGDASWMGTYTLEGGNDRGPTKTIVGVRASNAVILVTYGRSVSSDPQGRLAKGALEAAKAMVAKLG